MLIDSHAHIYDLEDCQSVIDSMEADCLEAVIVPGYDYISSVKAADLAKSNPRVFAAAGVHPSYAKEQEDAVFDRLYSLVKTNKKVIAIGEFGLDYHYDNLDKAAQKRAVNAQIELTCKTGLPAILHIRDAYADMLEIIKTNRAKISSAVIVHCFTGSAETARELVKLGCYISFSGTVTFNNARRAPEAVAAVPKDRVLIETDSPYLAPQRHRGKVNYPKYVAEVAQRIADIWQTDYEKTSEILTQNIKTAFNLKGL